MATTKKLIEVALPLEAINREAARERSVRQGHPSKLHLWWSRKPLAICRAVLFASLIDDPDQPGVSPALLTEIDRLPLPRAAGLDWQSLSTGEQRRQKLFAFMERLIAWEHSNNDDVLMTAQRLIYAATGGNPPPVYDPFSGGGSIPLEAQRLGLSTFASDLNPVAVLITKALIELPAPFVDMPPVNPEARAARAPDDQGAGARAARAPEETLGARAARAPEETLGARAARAPEDLGAPAARAHKGWYSRGYLPHFDQPGLIQMITYRLADSIPAERRAEWQSLLRHTDDVARRKKIETYLDAGYGSCSLRDERIARLVEENLLHFDGHRYRLLAWVIMPNHVHVLIETFPGYPLDKIVQSWKSYTAKEANRILGRTGEFWQAEYFDRYIRDERHLSHAVRYIHENPVKAGLVSCPEEWQYSSAARAGGPPAIPMSLGERAASPLSRADAPSAVPMSLGERAASPLSRADAPSAVPASLGERAAGPLSRADMPSAILASRAGEPPARPATSLLPGTEAGEPPARPATSPDPENHWKGAAGLAADVQYYGQWIRDEAVRRIGHLYPNIEVFLDRSDGAVLSASDVRSRYPHLSLADHQSLPSFLSPLSIPVLAWLWARTVCCPNPACGVQMPLVNSFTISTRKGRTAWAEPVVDRAARRVQFVVRHTAPPPLEGTVGRNGVRCLVCGHTSPLQYVRSEGQAGRLGEQLMAIVAAYQGDRVFLSPDQRTIITDDLQPGWRPDSDIARNPRHMTPPLYGMTTFDRLFSPRQLLALTTFSDLIRAVRSRILEDAARGGDRDSVSYMRAIVTYLALALDKAANVWSSLTSWKSDDGVIRGAFARQALAIVWVYAEANPFSTASESFERAVASVCEVLDRLAGRRPGCAEQHDATCLNTAVPHLFSTDPPYYDNVPYADLSDYFYVWLRHALGDLYPELMSTLLVPKAAELVADPVRHGGLDQARQYFEAGMRRVFTSIHRSQHTDYPLTLFYAYKQSEQRSDAMASTGWETMLESLIGSGWMITGTWPMRTERAGRLRETDSNALASSIVLTCRSRSTNAPAATRREFLHALKSELPHALRRLQQGNIAPVDLAQAAIGPGIAIFSRYSVVLETDSTPMTVRTALQMINQELDVVLAEQEGEFDAATRWALAWFDQYGMNEGPYGVAETLSKAKNTSVESMVEAGIIAARSGKVRLLKCGELPDTATTARIARMSIWEATQHLVRALEHGGERAAAMLLAAAREPGGAARDLAYRLYTTCERKGWAQEAFAYNSLVVAWPEVRRLAAEAQRSGAVQQAMKL